MACAIKLQFQWPTERVSQKFHAKSARRGRYMTSYWVMTILGVGLIAFNMVMQSTSHLSPRENLCVILGMVYLIGFSTLQNVTNLRLNAKITGLEERITRMEKELPPTS